MRLLVVEDEPKLAALVARGLREEGYAVDVADRGEDAVWMAHAVADEHARRWFRRYWTFGVGSGAHVLVHALLETVRDTAERAHVGVHERIEESRP